VHAGDLRGSRRYPLELPYAIAEAPKGYGFPGAGTNLAHNLPLGANPSADAEARKRFNAGARGSGAFLELVRAIGILNQGEAWAAYPSAIMRSRNRARGARTFPSAVAGDGKRARGVADGPRSTSTSA